MTVVCIAGMHRSGTSLVARMLNRSGLFLGSRKDLIPAADDNPEGFWEHRGFHDLNERILSILGGSWDLPPAVGPGWEDLPALAACRKEAARLIGAMGERPAWGWKDPRNCLTLPFWRRLIPDLKVVVCLRNPHEVARSLARRGYASDRFSARLWRMYYESLLDAVPETGRILTHYNAFFHDPESELRRLLVFLGLPRDSRKIRAASGEVKPELRHARSTFADMDGAWEYAEAAVLYARLCLQAGPTYAETISREAGWNSMEGKQPRSYLAAQAEKQGLVFQSVRGRLHNMELAVRNLSSQMEEKDGALRRLEGKVKERDEALHAQTVRAEEQERKNRELAQRAAEGEREARELARRVKEGERAAELLEAQVRRKGESIRGLTARVEELDRTERSLTGRLRERDRIHEEISSRLKETQQAAGRSLQELEEIKGGAAWKVFQLLRILRRFFIPYGSRREKGWRLFTDALRALRYEGVAACWRRISAERTASPAPPADPVPEELNDPLRQVYADWMQNVQRRNRDEYVPISLEDFDPRSASVKAIAFYLPQFHPIPENDRWWGKGFTEWTNVPKAVPNFIGHYQPRLPGELGFYDLRLPEVQRRQVELARKYGIFGFCFHYYWFGGKRLLERPLVQFLKQADVDFPFCICWANENWTRRWDGAEHDVLIAQVHTEDEYEKFIRDLLPFLRDPRYIRVDGKPLLIVYRVDILPDARKAAEAMRSECRRNGIDDLYLVAAQTFNIGDPRPYGFDAAVEFPPHNMSPAHLDGHHIHVVNPEYAGEIFDYARAVQLMAEQPVPEYTLFRTAMPSWDNTARKQNTAFAFLGSTPGLFRQWLMQAIQYTRRVLPADKQFVFINSWNEWGEGAYLEPDRRYGYAYLQATARALAFHPPAFPGIDSSWTILFISHDATVGGAQAILLNTISWMKRHTSIRLKVLCLSGGEWLWRFRATAETVTMDELQEGADSHTDEVLIDRLTRFCGGIPQLVYGNTVAAGREYAWLRKMGAPILTHVLELESSIRHYAAEWIGDIVRDSAHLVACSNAVRDNLIEQHKANPAAVTVSFPSIVPGEPPPGTEDEQKDCIKAELGLVRGKYLVFGCGVGMPFRKGADLFIELAAILRRGGRKDFHFYWLGWLEKEHRDPTYGNWADYVKRLRNSDLNDFVTFLITKDNPREYLRAGDVFVLTSREEPFGMVALEAADAGLPVLCFDNAGAADFIGEDAGFVIPGLDVDAMARKLELLLSRPQLRRTLGERGREKALAGFTLERTTRPLLSVCRCAARRQPAVSVIVPNYNHARYLPERLDSIFGQTFQDFEAILLDDASTDGSPAVMERYADRGDVRIMRNERNSGSPFPQWLKGIGAARADILWIAESDDRCDLQFLESLLPAFTDPEVKLAYSNSYIIDESGAVTGDYMDSPYLTDLSPTKWRSDYTVTAEREINDGLGVKDTILNASAVLFRKFEPEEEFRDLFARMRTVGDWLFFARAIRDGKVRYDARKLNYHRRHAESVIGRIIKNKKLDQFFRDFCTTQRFIIDCYPFDDEFPEKWEAYLRQQWNDFFPGASLEGLRKYYPFDEMKERVLRNAARRSGVPDRDRRTNGT